MSPQRGGDRANERGSSGFLCLVRFVSVVCCRPYFTLRHCTLLRRLRDRACSPTLNTITVHVESSSQNFRVRLWRISSFASCCSYIEVVQKALMRYGNVRGSKIKRNNFFWLAVRCLEVHMFLRGPSVKLTDPAAFLSVVWARSPTEENIDRGTGQCRIGGPDLAPRTVVVKG